MLKLITISHKEKIVKLVRFVSPLIYPLKIIDDWIIEQNISKTTNKYKKKNKN